MVVGRGSKGKETVSTVDGEMTLDKAAEEKPVQAEEEWWSSDSEEGSLETLDDTEDDEEEDANALAQWANTGLVAELGNGGVILVLFETPSGFAIFSYDGVKLFEPDAFESIWADFANDRAADNAVVLKDFIMFEDKVDAINQHTGINEALSEMIKKHIRPDTKLAVASEEYKTIIENNMRISCLCPPCVVELMWGLKIQMHSLVTAETSVFFAEDELPMCSGMISLLSVLGCDVEPDMKVSRRIIETAGIIYECNRSVNRHKDSLLDAAEYLKEISDFNTESWDLLKLATSFKMLCFPREKVSYPKGLFSRQELLRMKQDAPQYENKLLKMHCSAIHGEILWLDMKRFKFCQQLMPLIKRAKKSYEAKREATNGHEISPDVKKIRPGINCAIIDELRDYDSMILSQRKKIQVPPSLVSFDALERYTLISSHRLHRAKKPGILSIDIHPVKQDIVATGGIDKNAVLFDLSRQTMCTLTGHSKKITSLKFVNRDELLITGSADKTVRIWKGREDGNYTFIHSLEDHTAAVKAIAVHGTQNYFVTVSKDNSWCFYDTSTGSCLTQIDGASGKEGYSSASFHPYGSILGTGTTDAFVKIWDVQTQVRHGIK